MEKGGASVLVWDRLHLRYAQNRKDTLMQFDKDTYESWLSALKPATLAMLFDEAIHSLALFDPKKYLGDGMFELDLQALTVLHMAWITLSVRTGAIKDEERMDHLLEGIAYLAHDGDFEELRWGKQVTTGGLVAMLVAFTHMNVMIREAQNRPYLTINQ